MGGVRYGIPNLAAIRGSRGVSLRQIADATRIGMYYLQAIEGGNIDKLPPGIYARSYIRQYARAIDYDEAELLRRFELTADGEEDAEDPPPVPGGWMNRLLQYFRPLPHSRTEGSSR
jgi:cytoskeletal protein RodZ